MKSQDAYGETQQTWNKVALMYQEKFMDLEIYDSTYDRFCDLLPSENSSVLELGCGPGNITRYILKKRPDLEILSTDASAEMLKLAKINNPAAQHKILDARDILELGQTFNGIIAGFCIPYLDVNAVKKLFTDTKTILEAPGILYVSALEGNYADSGFESGVSGRVYLYYYSAAVLENILHKAGFKVLHKKILLFQRKGKDENHIVFIVKKNF